MTHRDLGEEDDDRDEPQSADMDDDDTADDLDVAACPVCGGAMVAEAVKCPHCGRWVTPVYTNERSLRRYVWPVIVLAVAAALSYVWVLR